MTLDQQTKQGCLGHSLTGAVPLTLYERSQGILSVNCLMNCDVIDMQQ